MITASRRASATIAFFIPRCLAIFIAQALSQDHFAARTKESRQVICLLAPAARLAKAREKRKNWFGVHSENLGYVYFLY
jgi:hypothetical protein